MDWNKRCCQFHPQGQQTRVPNEKAFLRVGDACNGELRSNKDGPSGLSLEGPVGVKKLSSVFGFMLFSKKLKINIVCFRVKEKSRKR